jgi:hypothetical protein
VARLPAVRVAAAARAIASDSVRGVARLAAALALRAIPAPRPVLSLVLRVARVLTGDI